MINSINKSLIEIIYVLNTIKCMMLNSHETRSDIKLHKVCNINILVRRFSNGIANENLYTIGEFLISKFLCLNTVVVSFLQELLVGNSLNNILRIQLVKPFYGVLESCHIIFKTTECKQVNCNIENFIEILCKYCRCT